MAAVNRTALRTLLGRRRQFGVRDDGSARRNGCCRCIFAQFAVIPDVVRVLLAKLGVAGRVVVGTVSSGSCVRINKIKILKIK
jgi:hypothetical protein